MFTRNVDNTFRWRDLILRVVTLAIILDLVLVSLTVTLSASAAGSIPTSGNQDSPHLESTPHTASQPISQLMNEPVTETDAMTETEAPPEPKATLIPATYGVTGAGVAQLINQILTAEGQSSHGEVDEDEGAPEETLNLGSESMLTSSLTELSDVIIGEDAGPVPSVSSGNASADLIEKHVIVLLTGGLRGIKTYVDPESDQILITGTVSQPLAAAVTDAISNGIIYTDGTPPEWGLDIHVVGRPTRPDAIKSWSASFHTNLGEILPEESHSFALRSPELEIEDQDIIDLTVSVTVNGETVSRASAHTVARAYEDRPPMPSAEANWWNQQPEGGWLDSDMVRVDYWYALTRSGRPTR